MKKFMFLTFAFLGWAFYEMSGGAEFAPEEHEAAASSQAAAPAVATDDAAEKTVEPEKAAGNAGVDIALAPKATKATAVDDAKPASLAVIPRPAAQVRPAPERKLAILDQPAKTVPEPDIRQVSGSLVNLRAGPGTSHRVVDQLTRGTRVVVLSDPGNGWIELHAEGADTTGWMADYLVTAAN